MKNTSKTFLITIDALHRTGDMPFGDTPEHKKTPFFR